MPELLGRREIDLPPVGTKPGGRSKIKRTQSTYIGQVKKTIFSQKLRVRIKDNNISPHGKFQRFLFSFSSKFSDLNFASYVLHI